MTKKSELRALPGNLDVCNLGALEELHSQILATASDLGYEPSADCLVEITSEEQGRTVVQALHAGLTEHRERLETQRREVDKKELAADAGRRDTAAGGRTTKKSAQEKMADQKAARLARDAQKPAAEAADKEKTVAKTAKKAATGKKPAAKKSAKKTASKKAKGGNGDARGRSVPEGKIEWILPKEQGLGAREGTERHARRELLRKHGGRTVASYVEAGGRVATLNRAVTEKVVRVVRVA